MQSQMARLDQRIYDNKIKIQQLQREKEQVLDEMRNGLFCSECKRSKREIERTGVGFEKHLRDVNGHPVASAATLAEKAAFYDRQIAALQNQINDLERMKGQLADVASRQADMERQRAAAAQARQQRDSQLAAERRQMEQMKAQLDQGQRERNRIVQKAEAIGESNRRAAQTVNDIFQNLGNQLQRNLEEKQRERAAERAEKEARDAEAQYDRQMEALEQKIAAQQEKLAQLERAEVPTAGSAGGGGSLELPPPVQIYEPPGEDQIARGQTGTGNDETSRQLAMMKAKESGGSIFAVPAVPEPPYRPEIGLRDYIEAAGQVLADAGQDVVEHLRAGRESLTEYLQDNVQPKLKRHQGYVKTAGDKLREFSHSTTFQNFLEDRGLDLATGKELDLGKNIAKKGVETLLDAALLEKYSQARFHKSYDQLDLSEQIVVDQNVKWTVDAVRYRDPVTGLYKWDRARMDELKKYQDQILNDLE